MLCTCHLGSLRRDLVQHHAGLQRVPARGAGREGGGQHGRDHGQAGGPRGGRNAQVRSIP